jgi:hypothetical protein
MGLAMFVRRGRRLQAVSKARTALVRVPTIVRVLNPYCRLAKVCFSTDFLVAAGGRAKFHPWLHFSFLSQKLID